VKNFYAKFDSRRNLDKVTIVSSQQELKGLEIPCFETIINRRVELAESPIQREDIFAYYRKGQGASDYYDFAREVLTWPERK
jgi:cellulose biosynthesis protein BcsQ